MAVSSDPTPRVCFEFRVEKILNASGDGSYQVQWAPSWVNILHLVGCDHLIQEFLQQQRERRDLQSDPSTLYHQQLPSEVSIKPDPEHQFGTQVVMRYVEDDNSEIDVEVMLPPGSDVSFQEDTGLPEENNLEKDLSMNHVTKINNYSALSSGNLTEINDHCAISSENDTLSKETSTTCTSRALESISDSVTTFLHSLLTNNFSEEQEHSLSPDVLTERADQNIHSEELVMNRYSLRHLTGSNNTETTTSENLTPAETSNTTCASTDLENKDDNNATCITDTLPQQSEESSLPDIQEGDSLIQSEEPFMNSYGVHQGKDISPSSDVVTALRKGDKRYHIKRPRKSIRLDNHRQVVNTHKYKSYSCNSCGFTSFRRTDKKFPCTHCGSSITSVSNNKENQELGKETKSHSCEICKKSFAYKNNLKQHMLLHTRKKPPKEELNRRKPKETKETKGTKETKSYSCDICKKSFTRKFSLQKHSLLHAPKKPLKSKKPIKYKKPMKFKRTIQGKKPFQCYECGKFFNNKSHLAEHINVHTGERPWVCEKCGKGFKAGSGLRSHRLKNCTVDA